MNLKYKLATCITAILLIAANPATAQTPTTQKNATTYGLLKAAATFGGDDLIDVQFRNAPDETIEAGGLLLLGLGFAVEPGTSGVGFQASINYHFDSVDASNGDASFERWPVEMLLFFGSQHRIGFGISLHLSPTLEADFETADGKVKFDNALGTVIEYNYKLSPNALIGLRHTNIDYDVKNSNTSVDGSHSGITFSFLF